MDSLLRCYSVVVLGLLLLLCTSANVRAVSFGKSVNVSVRAKWEGTSILLEAGLDFHSLLHRSPAESDSMEFLDCGIVIRG